MKRISLSTLPVSPSRIGAAARTAPDRGRSPVALGRWLLCAGLVLAATPPVLTAAEDALSAPAAWTRPDEAHVLQVLETVLEAAGAEAPQREEAQAQLAEALEKDETDRLGALLQATALGWPAFRERWATLQRSPETLTPEDLAELPSELQPNLTAWVGRALARERLYDEALQWLTGLEAQATVDPASVLFFRGACHHALLHKDEALADLRKLLTSETLPSRYARTGQLMIADLSPLETDSLDEISRMMSDVSRRLSLGRADDPVQRREQEVIDKLDKMIEQMEQQRQQQQQQQQQASGSGSNPAQGAQPMEDSQIAGGSGPGDVDARDVGDRSGWGDLPPAEREEALQAISQDLPTHYREAIEAYFRKLATESSGTP